LEINNTDEMEFVLEPLAVGLEKSVEDDPEIMRTAFGKKNRILVGKPKILLFEPKEFGLRAQEVKGGKREGFDFLSVATTVSFLPDFGCKFVSADFSITFSTDRGLPHSLPRPIVIGMRPREAVRKEDYKSQHKSAAKLSGSVSPGFAKVSGELSETSSFQVGGKAVIRDIYAFGLNGTEAGWRFQASLGHELAGIYEDLALAVRRPANSALFGEVRFGAEIAVKAVLDRWATVAFGLSVKRSVEKSFELFRE
jgi:hypothetical protein